MIKIINVNNKCVTKKLNYFKRKENKLFDNKELLNEIFICENTGDNYIIFEHDDKVWVMPELGLETAFEMYQPSTVKGKIYKIIAIALRNNSWVLDKLGMQNLLYRMK